jgi:hypothetical protein
MILHFLQLGRIPYADGLRVMNHIAAVEGMAINV